MLYLGRSPSCPLLLGLFLIKVFFPTSSEQDAGSPAARSRRVLVRGVGLGFGVWGVGCGGGRVDRASRGWPVGVAEKGAGCPGDRTWKKEKGVKGRFWPFLRGLAKMGSAGAFLSHDRAGVKGKVPWKLAVL